MNMMTYDVFVVLKPCSNTETLLTFPYVTVTNIQTIIGSAASDVRDQVSKLLSLLLLLARLINRKDVVFDE